MNAALLFLLFLVPQAPVAADELLVTLQSLADPAVSLVPRGSEGFSLMVHSDDGAHVEMTDVRWSEIRNVVFTLSGDGAWLLLEREEKQTAAIFLGRRNESEVWPLVEALQAHAARQCGCDVGADAVY